MFNDNTLLLSNQLQIGNIQTILLIIRRRTIYNKNSNNNVDRNNNFICKAPFKKAMIHKAGK